MSAGDYTGLSLLAPTGMSWVWVGRIWITNRHGEAVRIERWQSLCRKCGEPFTVTAKLPGGLRQHFFERRAWTLLKEGEKLDVRIRVPEGLRIRNFELRNCPKHRWAPAPLPESAEALL